MFRVSFNFDTLLAEAQPVQPDRRAVRQSAKAKSLPGLSRKEMCQLFFPDAVKSGKCARCNENCFI